MNVYPTAITLTIGKEIILTFDLNFDEHGEKSGYQNENPIKNKTYEATYPPKLETNLTAKTVGEVATAIIITIIKRYTMLRRALSDDEKKALDNELTDHILEGTRGNFRDNTITAPFLKKEKRAAFQHIKNSLSGTILTAIQYNDLAKKTSIEAASNIVARLFQATVNELYTGDQRFYKEKIKTRSEVAKQGGIARKQHYAPAKQKACELINSLAPSDGWNNELDAFKSILPEIKSYLLENGIKRPALSSIERTLRRWIKNDPLVSVAMKVKEHSS